LPKTLPLSLSAISKAVYFMTAKVGIYKEK
jgi:hypothetical protein